MYNIYYVLLLRTLSVLFSRTRERAKVTLNALTPFPCPSIIKRLFARVNARSPNTNVDEKGKKK